MAAGSVRLPTLHQDIKVNTRDLTNAMNKAARFKAAMDRSLDVDATGFQAKLKSIEGSVSSLASESRQAAQGIDTMQRSLSGVGRSAQSAERGLSGFSRQASRTSASTALLSSSTGRASRQLRDLDRSSSRGQRALGQLSRQAMQTAASLTAVGASMGALALGGGALSAAVGGVGQLGTALLGLGPAIGQTAGLIGTLPGFLTTAAGGIAVLATAIIGNDGLKPALDRLGDSFKPIRDDIQKQLTPAISGFLDAVGTLAPGIRKVAPQMTGALQRVMDRLGETVRSAGFHRDIEYLFSESAKNTEVFGKAANHVFIALTDLAVAASPAVRTLTNYLGNAALKFQQLVHQGRDSGALADYFNRGVESATRLLGIVGDAGAAIIDMGRKAGQSGLGEAIIGGLERGMTGLRSFVNETGGAFDRLLARSRQTVEAIGPLFSTLGSELVNVFADIDLSPLIKAVTRILPQVGDVFTDLGNSAVAVFTRLEPAARSALTGIGGLISPVRESLLNLADILDVFIQSITPSIQGAVRGVSQVIDRAASGVKSFLRDAGRSVDSFIQSIRASDIGNTLGKSFEAVGNAVEKLEPLFAAVGRALSYIGSTALYALQPIAGIVGGIASAFGSLPGPIQTVIAGMGLIAAFRSRFQAVGSAVTEHLSNPFRGFRDNLSTARSEADRSTSAISSGVSRIGVAMGTLQANYPVLQRMADSYRKVEAAVSRSIGPQQQLVGVVQQTSGVFGHMVPALNRAQGAMGGFVAQSAGMAAAIGTGLRGAVSGLVGALGGPWGIAIAGAVTALGFLANAQQKSAREAQEHQQRVSTLSDTLDKQSGAATRATRDIRAKELATTGAVKSARDLGLAENDLLEAVTGNQDKFRGLNDQLKQHARAAVEGSNQYKNYKRELDAMGLSLDDLAGVALGSQGSIDKMNNAIARIPDLNAQASMKMLRDSLKDVDPAGRSVAETLQRMSVEYRQASQATRDSAAALGDSTGNSQEAAEALDTLASSASTTEDRISALKVAFEALQGGQRSVDEASANMNDRLRELSESATEFKTHLQATGQSALDASGNLNTTSEAGSRYAQSMHDAVDATLESAQAGYEHIRSTKGQVEANRFLDETVGRTRQTLIDQMTSFGLSAQEAEAYANRLKLTPDVVRTLIETPGMSLAQVEAQVLADQVNAVPEKKLVTAEAVTDPAKKQLEDLGYKVTTLPDGKTEITLDTTGAMDRARELEGQVNALPDKKLITPYVVKDPAARALEELGYSVKRLADGRTEITVNADRAKSEADALKAKVDALPERKLVQAEAVTQPARAALEALGYTVRDLPNGQVEITLNDGAIQSKVQGITNQINAMPNKTVIIDAPTADVQSRLQSLGYQITTLPNGQVEIRAIDQATAPINGIIGSISGIPPTANSTMQFHTGAAHGQVQGILDAILGVPDGNATQHYAIGGAQGNVNAITGSINGVPDGQATMFFQTQGAHGAANGIASAIRAQPDGHSSAHLDTSSAIASQRSLDGQLQGKTYYQTIKVAVSKIPIVGGLISGMMAEGGVLKPHKSGSVDVPSGMRPMSSRIADVVGPNTWRVIGDRQIGKEAFIPLVRGNKRSEDILRYSAEELGYEVKKFANGAVSQLNRFNNNSVTPMPSPSFSRSSTPVSMEQPPVYVTVYLGDEKILDRQRVMARMEDLKLSRSRGTALSGGVVGR